MGDRRLALVDFGYRKAGGTPGLKAPDQVGGLLESQLPQAGGCQAGLEAFVAHHDEPSARVRHPLVAPGRVGVAAPLEHVARDEHGAGHHAVALALGLRPDVHDQRPGGQGGAGLRGLQAGKLRALGVTGRNRLAYLPDVPILTEAGVSGMEIDAGWFGLFAPANVPAEIVTKLSSEIRAALANPQVRERLQTRGFMPVGNSPAEFKVYVESEIRAYAEMVKLAGIEPE